MEKGKDPLNAYLAGLKNSCSTECLRSLQVRKLTPPTEGPTAHFISKIQQTSSTSKKKNSYERSDTLFNGSYEFMHRYTPPLHLD